jgi:hypothetical protein
VCLRWKVRGAGFHRDSVAFFSLPFALAWGDLSLVAPAASLTFIGNAIAAKIFLLQPRGSLLASFQGRRFE